MTGQLLALSIGPVQEFIAAARRTRDLWFGSYLLSEISKAAAKSVQGNGGKLIFPAPDNASDLNPDSQLNVANIILAEVGESKLAAVAETAKKAAQACWRKFADQVLQEYRPHIRIDLWNDQVDDVIEFYAAWLPYSPETYTSDRVALMRLLSARKRCRDFLPAKGRAGIPKSSLDGLRESVLLEDRPSGSQTPLRLAGGEQLDVVGLVKRAWRPVTGNPNYPSVARIAADPWIRLLQSKDVDLSPLIQACEALGPEVVRKLGTSPERGYPQFAAFPFEGTALYRCRQRSLRKECEIPDSDQKFAGMVAAREGLSAGARDKRIPAEPSPYLAILVADGDRMGQVLSRLNSPIEHRQFSKALAQFAAQAREIVRVSQGALVYAGGDDVLAFVPVDHCLRCARELHDAFADALKPYSNGGNPPSLSVGVAVAHFMEPLEDLLAYGRAAEHHAKHPRPADGRQDDRNGLAVHVVKRGGGPVAVRANWHENLDGALATLGSWIGAQSVPNRVAYDLHQISVVYDNWPQDSAKEAIQKDVLSVMQGKEPRGESKMSEIANLIEKRVSDADSLRILANRLLVAKAIAAMPSMPRSEKPAP